MIVREAARRWFVRDRMKQQAARRADALPVRTDMDEEYIFMVREAWEQWQAAQNYFEAVSDPDLVDYAIYDVEAARRRYVYMLKNAQRDFGV